MRLDNRVSRLERATQVATSVLSLPPVPATGEEAAWVALELLERIKARAAELDAALVGDNSKRRVWARRTIAEHKKASAAPEAQVWIAESMEILARIRARQRSGLGAPSFLPNGSEADGVN